MPATGLIADMGTQDSEHTIEALSRSTASQQLQLLIPWRGHLVRRRPLPRWPQLHHLARLHGGCRADCRVHPVHDCAWEPRGTVRVRCLPELAAHAVRCGKAQIGISILLFVSTGGRLVRVRVKAERQNCFATIGSEESFQSQQRIKQTDKTYTLHKLAGGPGSAFDQGWPSNLIENW